MADINPNIAHFARKSEPLMIDGRKFTVRQVRSASELVEVKDSDEANYRLIIKCLCDEAGNPVFTDADIPALKEEASEINFLPVLRAIARVNGLDVEERAKNSEAAPSGG